MFVLPVIFQPRPWPNDLDMRPWPVASEDVRAFQTNFLGRGFQKLWYDNWQTYMHADMSEFSSSTVTLLRVY